MDWRSFTPVVIGGYGVGILAAVSVRLVTAGLSVNPILEAAIAAILTIGVGIAVLRIVLRGPHAMRRTSAIAASGGWRVLLRERRERAVAGPQVEALHRELPSIWLVHPVPLVTVRIPTYNRGQLIADRAIASALVQTHQNIEIVVVGDACDDATARAVTSVNDSRVRFENLPQRGTYPMEPSRRWMVAGVPPVNRALELARGEWIAPLDDDDEFMPDHVERLLDACRTHAVPFAYGVAEMEVSPGSMDARRVVAPSTRPNRPRVGHVSGEIESFLLRHRRLANPRAGRLEPVEAHGGGRRQDAIC